MSYFYVCFYVTISVRGIWVDPGLGPDNNSVSISSGAPLAGEDSGLQTVGGAQWPTATLEQAIQLQSPPCNYLWDTYTCLFCM